MNFRQHHNTQPGRGTQPPPGFLESLAIQEQQRLIDSLRQVNLLRMTNQTHLGQSVPPLASPVHPSPPFSSTTAGSEVLPGLSIEATRQYLSQMLQPMPYMMPSQLPRPAFPTPYLTPINTALQPVSGKLISNLLEQEADIYRPAR